MIKHKLQTFGFLLAGLLVGSFGWAQVAMGATPADCTPADVNGTIQSGTDCASTTQQQAQHLNTTIANVTNILIFIVGFASIIVLVIAGLQYVFSGGDEKKVESAKNRIIYAIVGVIVAVLAYAIVNFALAHFLTAPTAGT